jgi:hypothetical protein
VKCGESFPIEGGSACTVFNSRKRRLAFHTFHRFEGYKPLLPEATGLSLKIVYP